MTKPANPADLSRETGKQAYETPKIVSREPLEFVAAVCTPSPPAKADFGACPSGPANS